MDDFLAHLIATSPSAIGWAIAGGAVWLVLTGRLVQGKERDAWRDAYLSEHDKTQKLTVGAEVQRDFLTSLGDVLRDQRPQAKKPQRRQLPPDGGDDG